MKVSVQKKKKKKSGQIIPCLPGAPASMLQEAKKKKTSTTEAAHRKKSNNHQSTSYSCHSWPSGVKIVPSQGCLLLALCACRPWRRTRCRCGDFRCHHQLRCCRCRAVDRHILPGSRGHEGLAALCLVERTVNLPYMAWYAPASSCSGLQQHVYPISLCEVCLVPGCVYVCSRARGNRHYLG